MRADNERVFGNSIESLEGDGKAHRHPDHNELKIPRNGNENARGLSCDARADKVDGEVNGSHFSAEEDLLEKKGSVFYMDKNVTACDLPEIVVCYKENTYHVVKDICVDEGVTLKGKVLSNSNRSCKCDSEDPNKAQVDVNASMSGYEVLAMLGDVKDATDVQESSTGSYADAGESRKRSLENLIVAGEVPGYVKDMPTLDVPGNDSDKHICTQGKSENLEVKEEAGIAIKESLSLADVMSMEDCKKPFNHKSHGPEEQSSQESIGKRRTLSLKVDGTENSGTGEVSPVMLLSEEASETERAKNDDLMDSGKASHGDSETGTRTKELQRPEPESCYLLEGLSDDHHPFPSHFMSGFGEMSFSAAEPVSGHITYSGPIAFSGSLSVRSDGSTTSTRSFAFPVLQSEWNSSPVRMAKADKRHIRSHRGWRDALCCCRF